MPKPGGILSLDLSLTTGFAYGGWGERPVFGHWNLGKMMNGHGTICCRLEDHIHDAIEFHRPRAIVYEAPFIPMRQENANVGKLLLGLATATEMASTRQSLPVYDQTANQARAKVLGKAPTGGADRIKPVIIAWAKSRGWATEQDDEADALILLVYAVVKLDNTRTAHFHRHGDVL